MPIFPTIASSCPYVDRLDTVMEGDFCRMCQRDVFDLTAMDDAGRAAFLAGCSGEVCVRYQPPRHAVFATAAALAAMALPVAAVTAADRSGTPRAAAPGKAGDAARAPIAPLTPADVGDRDIPMLAGMVALPPEPAPPRKADAPKHAPPKHRRVRSGRPV